MHRLTALYSVPDDREQFRRHLSNVHLPIVARFPKLRALRVGFDPMAGDLPSPYFAVVECDFDSEADLQAALGSEAGVEAVADVPNYAGAGFLILTFPMKDVPLG